MHIHNNYTDKFEYLMVNGMINRYIGHLIIPTHGTYACFRLFAPNEARVTNSYIYSEEILKARDKISVMYIPCRAYHSVGEKVC